MSIRMGALLALGVVLVLATDADAKDSGQARPALARPALESGSAIVLEKGGRGHGGEWGGRGGRDDHHDDGDDHGDDECDDEDEAQEQGNDDACPHGTPDCETPAEEVGCDDYYGSAYGWCTAACEAQDCGDPNQHSDQEACDNLADKFYELTGEELPCLGSDDDWDDGDDWDDEDDDDDGSDDDEWIDDEWVDDGGDEWVDDEWSE